MIIVLSPSKTLDMTPATGEFTQPQFLGDAKPLIENLRKYTPAKLSKLMDISDKLAELNVQRYKDFSTPFTPKNAKPALLAFKGDVYTGIEVEKYKKPDFAFAQEHVRILSGLYGLLRPLDLIQPYRLEMGTALKNPRGKDLYAYWGERITTALNIELAPQKDKHLINLASLEYCGAIAPKMLTHPMITVSFKEKQGETLKIIGLFAKKARGNMANFIIKNRLNTPESLKDFTVGGYQFTPKLSSAAHYVFVRKAS